MKLSLFTEFALFVLLGSCQEITINYGRKEFGVLSYNKESTEGPTFTLNERRGGHELVKQAQCFNTNDLKDHECFLYSSITNATNPLQSLQFWLYLDENKDIARISISSGEHPEGEVAVIKEIGLAPAPVLSNVAQMKKEKGNIRKPPMQKVIVTKVVEDEDGNKVEVQEEKLVSEEENLSWIEKNWRYLLIGFLVYLAVSGGGKSEEEQK
ncbi:uncharacterized protein KQ657_002689 [Scheffersomyces spartinae]|uniref:ER membrane protein complex subunit 10 n=1 Tax=Scheffersomyces spartinae TaxID=45513 RepID=A0A9P7V626_9ASCO|nr:uncharacterized protein KQ657_002689 [Scheffersomyces spartinae]KAG7191900.1 hypothetical protein KQ657_002689 [Scheffersomyces spartinae]